MFSFGGKGNRMGKPAGVVRHANTTSAYVGAEHDSAAWNKRHGRGFGFGTATRKHTDKRTGMVA